VFLDFVPQSGLSRLAGRILFNHFHVGAKASSTTGMEIAPIRSPMAPEMAAKTVHWSNPAAEGNK
jgi:hypothetical protein